MKFSNFIPLSVSLLYLITPSLAQDTTGDEINQVKDGLENAKEVPLDARGLSTEDAQKISTQGEEVSFQVGFGSSLIEITFSFTSFRDI
jgi:hypothetical protein